MTTSTDLVSARLALRWLILGEARAHPARFLGTMIAIAVGVALGFAIHLINGSALASFDGAVRSVNGAPVASGAVPGPITKRILDAYSQFVGCDFVGQYLRHCPAD